VPPRARLLVYLLSSGVAGCAAPLFPSRVDLAPLQAKLTASGGDRARILRPSSWEDLTALEVGRRYKLVVARDGRLAIAPLPADAPDNAYVHPILGDGRPVRTAGAITRRPNDTFEVDQDSKSYCPTYASLDAAVEALVRLGVPRARITRSDRPPACVAPPSSR